MKKIEDAGPPSHRGQLRRLRAPFRSSAILPLVALFCLASCKSKGPVSPEEPDPTPGPPGSPKVEVSGTSIGLPADSDQGEVTISNVGTAPLDWQIRSVTATWLNVSPTAGKLQPGASTSVTVRVDRARLAPGAQFYSAAFGVWAASRIIVVVVRVDPALPPQQVVLEPESFALGPSDASGKIDVVNHGRTFLDWTLTGPPWAAIDPAAGRLAPGARRRVVVIPDRSRLSTGSHSGTLSLSSNRGAATATLSVGVAAPPQVGITPSNLAFDSTATNLSLEIANQGGQPLDWSLTGPSWTALAPSSGQLSAGSRTSIMVTPDRSLLDEGLHTGTLAFSSNGGVATATMSVKVARAGSGGRLRLIPSTLDFGPTATQLSFDITNDGGRSVDWNVTGPTWASINPSAGVLNPGARTPLLVTVDRSQLSQGRHTGTVKVSSRGGGVTSATLSVDVVAAPQIRLQPSALDFASLTTQLSLDVVNEGGQALDWSAQTSAGWISLSAPSGRVAARSYTTLTATISRSGLSSGTHEGSIQFTSNGGTATARVVATVLAPASLRVSATSLDFGETLTDLPLRLSNDGDTALDWSGRSTTGWASLSSSSGRLAARSSQEIRVRVSRSGRSAGDYAGWIELTANGETIRVAISMKVLAPASLRVSATSLDFGETLTELPLRLYNDGDTGLDWSGRSTVGWASLSSLSWRIAALSSQEIKVSVSRSGRSAGDYAGWIELTANGETVRVAVSMKVPSTATRSDSVNVRNYGAKGDGLTDDTQAFRAALTALPATGGILAIPAGTYSLTASTVGINRVIDLSRRSNVTIAGAGLNETILRMRPGSYTGATDFVLIDGSSLITIRDLTIDGNKASVSYTDEQSHGIEVVNSAQIRFERIMVTGMYSDGMRLLGAAGGSTAWADQVSVVDCHFSDHGRAGIGVQRAVRGLRVTGTTFTRIKESSIKMEPTGAAMAGDLGPTDFVISNNHFFDNTGTLAITVEGVSTLEPARGMIVADNQFDGGGIFVYDAHDVHIERNVIRSETGRGERDRPITVEKNSQDVWIVGNDIDDGSGSGGIALHFHTSEAPKNVHVLNNTIRVPVGGHGFYAGDSEQLTVSGNQITGRGTNSGVLIEDLRTGSPLSGFLVEQNTIDGFEYGIQFKSTGDVLSGACARNNTITNVQKALNLQGPVATGC